MLTFILGGARSGKSSLALRLAGERAGDDVAFVATCVAGDAELSERVRRHRADRPAGWRTLEEPLDLAGAMQRAVEAGARAVVIDCLTLWLFNATEAGWSDDEVLAAAATAADAARDLPGLVLVVSNELGWGVVPATESGRRFRDLQGRVNQLWAAASHETFLVVAGLPLSLKSSPS